MASGWGCWLLTTRQTTLLFPIFWNFIKKKLLTKLPYKFKLFVTTNDVCEVFNKDSSFPVVRSDQKTWQHWINCDCLFNWIFQHENRNFLSDLLAMRKLQKNVDLCNVPTLTKRFTAFLKFDKMKQTEGARHNVQSWYLCSFWENCMCCFASGQFSKTGTLQ